MTTNASLLALAHAVADGEGVDWESAEASAHTVDERLAITQLRHLASVSEAARASAAQWGPLEIRSAIGSATFGTVYRAWDRRLEREVALKLLNGEYGERQRASTVVAEGRLLAQIRHQNVVTVFGADEHNGRVGIWMEFVSGRTLKDILGDQGPFGAQEAAVIGRDLCRALAAVHRLGFLHRDVKAQNVMREAGGRTVLMDFGAGEVVDADRSAGASLAGTPAYLAPELLDGAVPTVRSDIYSLGVLLFYLVSGEFPVVGGSLAELRERHKHGPRRRLYDVRPDLPSDFVQVVDRATATAAADRPESAGAMEQLLDALFKSATQEKGGQTPPRPAKMGLVLGAVLALLVIAAMGVRWIGSRPGTAAIPAVTTRNSVAILPFRNLSAAGQDNDYFSEGITDDLVAQLGMLRDLRVISGSSMRRYKDRVKPETEIGAELGVAAVLDGSVRQSGDRVRIVSRLVDSKTGEQLWSESFERDLKDIFSMQSEVARRIAVALKGELTEPDAATLSHTRSGNVQAFKLYLKGRYYWSLRTEDGFNRSIEAYRAALDQDPEYALVHAALADTYTLMGVYGITPRLQALSRAADEATKAVSLDGSLAEAHASLGYVQKNRFQWEAAEASFKRSLQLKPRYEAAHLWYGTFLTQQGRFADAISELKVALALDPFSISTNSQFSTTLLLARRYDEAIAQVDRVMELDPSHTSSYQVLAEAHAFKKEYDRALTDVRRASQGATLGGEDQELQGDLGFILAMSGQKAKAEEIIQWLTNREKTGAPVAAAIATIYAALGQHDRAFDALERARLREESELGYLKIDPRWDTLRGDKRFETLLRQVGF